MTGHEAIPSVEGVASYRKLPSNQYHCTVCGKRHVYGSATGQQCGRTSQRTQSRQRPARAPFHQPTRSPSSARPARSSEPRPARPVPPRRPKPDRRQERRQRARESLTRDPSAIAGDAVALVFAEDSFYTRIANRALDKVPWHVRIRRRGHGLCVCLNELAKGLDPATYAKLAQTPVRFALLRLGFPKFLAEILGAATAFGVKQALGALPVAHLSTTLRVMIPLDCPNLDACPTRADVLKTFAGPFLAEELKGVVANLR